MRNPPSLQNRNPAMDLIRLTALFCVVSIHFFLHTSFYDTPVTNAAMVAATVMRNGFMVCVPLFLLLSGYLLKNRRASKRYYAKLVYTIVIYVLASFCCSLYRKPVISDLHGLVSYLVNLFDGLLNYSIAPYAWYVEMYIGLFPLIPWLNILYNALQTQQQRRYLILTMLLLTSFPGVINIYRFNPSWWLNPTSNHFYYKLLPMAWIDIFPITYYFIGAYLRDYPLAGSAKRTVLLTTGFYLFNGLFNVYRSWGSPHVQGYWHDYCSLFIVTLSVLIFTMFTKFDYSKFGVRTIRLISRLSELCFGAYLVSWIFDDWIYARFQAVFGDAFHLEHYFLIVPIVFVCSLTLSAVINTVYDIGANVIARIYHHFAPIKIHSD